MIDSPVEADKGTPVARRGRKAEGLYTSRSGRALEKRMGWWPHRGASRICVPSLEVALAAEAPGVSTPFRLPLSSLIDPVNGPGDPARAVSVPLGLSL